jgi:hypothetical protein
MTSLPATAPGEASAVQAARPASRLKITKLYRRHVRVLRPADMGVRQSAGSNRGKCAHGEQGKLRGVMSCLDSELQQAI